MGFTIALGGKGGTGKTTITGLLMRYMIKHGMKPILAIDADPNSNLNDVMGVQLDGTLSGARETMKKGVPTGITKDVFMELQLENCLVENSGYDLIAMGQPEGPGCYCAANNILSSLIDKLMANYEYLVIDNEAGMEHFSRLTQKDVDLLILVSDPSRRGLTAACRIAELVQGLPIRVMETVLVVNQLESPISSWPQDVAAAFDAEHILTLPKDPLIGRFDLEGKPTVTLPEDASIVQAAEAVFDRLLGGERKMLGD